MVHSPQVVSPPPKYQGSVLGRVVEEYSKLGQLLCALVALRHLTASVQAELATLRATKLFSFKVGRDKGYCICALCQTPGYKQESHAQPPILELVWEMCVRVPQLTRRIAALTDWARSLPAGELRAEVKANLADAVLSKKVAYPCVLHRAAGTDAYQKALRAGHSEADAIFSGEVARSKAIGSYTEGLFTEIKECRPEVKAAFISRFLTEKIKIALPDDRNGIGATHHLRPMVRYALPETEQLNRQDCIGQDCTDEQIEAWYPFTMNGVPNSSSVPNSFYVVSNEPEPSEKQFAALPVKPWVDSSRETFLTLFGELLESTRKAEDSLLPSFPSRVLAIDESVTERFTSLPNYCPTCQQYVKWRHDGPTGIPCKDYLKKIEADGVERVATIGEHTEQVVSRRASTSCGDGPINTNWVEDKWIARIDRNEALRQISAKCEPCDEPAPKVRKGGRKPKRRYVRHKK